MFDEASRSDRSTVSGKRTKLVVSIILGLMFITALACGGGSQEETFSIDPHEPRNLTLVTLPTAFGSTTGSFPDPARYQSVEDVLENGLDDEGLSPVHLVFRGTADIDSIRCEWRGRARTLNQRDTQMRIWLNLAEDDPLPLVTDGELLFTKVEEHYGSSLFHRELVRAALEDLARGGLSTNFLGLVCFADYSVAEYLLGSGPDSLTVSLGIWDGLKSYKLYIKAPLDIVESWTVENAVLSEGDYWASANEDLFEREEFLAGLLGGYEGVVFLAPAGAHDSITTEAWQAVDLWDLQRGDGALNAVRYRGDPDRREHVLALDELKSRIMTAVANDTLAGKRITNVGGLSRYYRDIGAYDDITPNDGITAPFIPAPPPPVHACAYGLSVQDSSVNRGLVHDCRVLRSIRDTLEGTDDLNWSVDKSIEKWEGVTVGEAPRRVTELELPGRRLSGTISPDLGTLSELTHLDLRSNSFTGNIPRELGWLNALDDVMLSGNSLTGCIPIALKDVDSNDLRSLNLPYCQPPAPKGLKADVVDETSLNLTWDEVPDITRYAVQYRPYRSFEPEEWTTVDNNLAETGWTFSGLSPEEAYHFRVSAHGRGSVFLDELSKWSTILTATSVDDDPKFDSPRYVFSIAEGAEYLTTVGQVSIGGSQRGVEYSIQGGNKGRRFWINPASGEIFVVAPLSIDRDPTTSYNLIVQANHGIWMDQAEVMVKIAHE